MSPVSQIGRYAGRSGRRVLRFVFPLLRALRPARERVVLGQFNDHVEREHLARYEFARTYCQGKVVADIACGSGYGTALLREAATQVDAYDREPLCGNIVLDLEKQAWTRAYDVIVSFETIEHLANPEFFLETASQTSRLLLVSTPIGEFDGYNPHHKQTWELPEFCALIGRWFDYKLYYQQEDTISPELDHNVTFVIAECTPKGTFT